MSSNANGALDGLTSRIAEQERASQRIVAETGRALAELDQKFTSSPSTAINVQPPSRSRSAGRGSSFSNFPHETGTQDKAVEVLAERAEALQNYVSRLTADVRGAAFDRDRRRRSRSLPPHRCYVDAFGPNSTGCARPRSKPATASRHPLRASRSSRTGLRRCLPPWTKAWAMPVNACSLSLMPFRPRRTKRRSCSNDTGPALVDAMVQVREAASHAAERAREAIAKVIPESAQTLSDATRDALGKRHPRGDRAAPCRRPDDRGPRRRCRTGGVGSPDRADADARPQRIGSRTAYGAGDGRNSAKRTARPSPGACRCSSIP